MWSKTINSSSMNKSACAVSLQERKKIERYWSFFIGTLISSCYCVALKCPKAASSPADQTLDECKVRSSSDSPISSIRVRPRTKARQNKFENFPQKWLKLDSWLCWQLNCSAIQDTKPSTRATSADRQIQFFFLKVRRSWPPAAISWFFDSPVSRNRRRYRMESERESEICRRYKVTNAYKKNTCLRDILYFYEDGYMNLYFLVTNSSL